MSDDVQRCYYCARRVPPPGPRLSTRDGQYLYPLVCEFTFCARFRKAMQTP